MGNHDYHCPICANGFDGPEAKCPSCDRRLCKDCDSVTEAVSGRCDRCQAERADARRAEGR